MPDRKKGTPITERDAREVDADTRSKRAQSSRGEKGVHHDVVAPERTVGSGDGAFKPGMEQDTRTDGSPADLGLGERPERKGS